MSTPYPHSKSKSKRKSTHLFVTESFRERMQSGAKHLTELSGDLTSTDIISLLNSANIKETILAIKAGLDTYVSSSYIKRLNVFRNLYLQAVTLLFDKISADEEAALLIANINTFFERFFDSIIYIDSEEAAHIFNFLSKLTKLSSKEQLVGSDYFKKNQFITPHIIDEMITRLLVVHHQSTTMRFNAYRWADTLINLGKLVQTDAIKINASGQAFLFSHPQTSIIELQNQLLGGLEHFFVDYDETNQEIFKFRPDKAQRWLSTAASLLRSLGTLYQSKLVNGADFNMNLIYRLVWICDNLTQQGYEFSASAAREFLIGVNMLEVRGEEYVSEALCQAAATAIEPPSQQLDGMQQFLLKKLVEDGFVDSVEAEYRIDDTFDVDLYVTFTNASEETVKLVIELDGQDYHVASGENLKQKDSLRDCYLKSQGYQIIRYRYPEKAIGGQEEHTLARLKEYITNIKEGRDRLSPPISPTSQYGSFWSNTHGCSEPMKRQSSLTVVNGDEEPQHYQI